MRCPVCGNEHQTQCCTKCGFDAGRVPRAGSGIRLLLAAMVIVLAMGAAGIVLSGHGRSDSAPGHGIGDAQLEAAHTVPEAPEETAAANTEPKLPPETAAPAETTPPAQPSEPDTPSEPEEPEKEVVLKSISIKSAPKKTSYFVGDRLDTSGLVLKAVYSDGTSRQIESGFTCEPTALSAAGNREIKVTYQGKRASFTVAVENVWSDWSTKLPDGVGAATHEIQEKTQYASSRITKWNRLPDGYDDLTEYDFYEKTTFITLDYGWSQWVDESEPSPAEKEPRLYYSYEVQREDAVQYRYRERDIFTGEFCSWSSWQLEEIVATEDRQVETRNAYRVRTIIVHSTRHYYQVEDGLWQNPVWGDTPIQKDENTAVRTRTVYRYREKAE